MENLAVTRHQFLLRLAEKLFQLGSFIFSMSESEHSSVQMFMGELIWRDRRQEVVVSSTVPMIGVIDQ